MSRYERATALSSDGLGFNCIFLGAVLLPFKSTARASTKLIGNCGTGLDFVTMR
jgi:hypothetical protein